MRHVVFFVFLTACGCGGPDQPVRVKGKVTLDGQPVEGATVTFLPEGKTGRNANARTRADGSFELTTFAPNDGVLAGTYKVVVEYFEPRSALGTFHNQQEAMQAAAKSQGQKKKPPRYAIPSQYGDPARTPLKRTIPSGGEILLELRTTET